jgi:capsular polysaccharide biosynthesis protein
MFSPQDGLLDRLKDICGQKSAADLLTGWFWINSGTCWAAPLRPYLATFDQIGCVQWAEAQKLTPLQGIALMLAFLGTSLQRNEWVHYNLVVYLKMLHQSGVAQAALPMALYSWLALEGFGPEDQGANLPREALAVSLQAISPRDAIRSGLLALRGGNFQGMRDCIPMLQQRGIAPKDGVFDLAAVSILNEKIGSPIEFHTQVAVSTANPSVRQIRCPLVEEVVHQAPAFGDTEHYIFAAAGVPVKLRPVDIVMVEDAVFSADLSKTGQPEFYTIAGNSCISDLSFGVRPFINNFVEQIDRPLLVTADAFSSNPNICHFLLDQVPRLLAYRKFMADAGAVLLIEKAAYFRDALRTAGVVDMVAPDQRRFSFRAPQLFLHSNMFRNWDHPANLGSPDTIRSLRQAFVSASTLTPRRRLVISRSDAVGRRILNWAEVQPVLAHHGYETVVLSGMSFDEQRLLFSGASHIVGVHGAGLTNILFAPADAKVLEILPPMVATAAYWMLANGIGQIYGALIADDPELPRPDYKNWKHDAAYNSRDLIVDPARLRACLRSMD